MWQRFRQPSDIFVAGSIDSPLANFFTVSKGIGNSRANSSESFDKILQIEYICQKVANTLSAFARGIDNL